MKTISILFFCITGIYIQAQTHLQSDTIARFATMQCDLKTVRYLSFKCEHKVLIDAKGMTHSRVLRVKSYHKYVILPFKFWSKKGLAHVLVLGDNCKTIEFTENYISINGEKRIYRDAAKSNNNSTLAIEASSKSQNTKEN